MSSRSTLAMVSKCLILSLMSKALVGFTILSAVNHVQDNAYMDEIFHVPQVQKYCNGTFSEWDPMITTLPGLYVMSAVLIVPAARVLNLPTSSVCSLQVLRGINLLFMLCNICLLYCISDVIHAHNKDGKKVSSRWLNAVCMAFFPLLYFFSFLYYTDAGSVFWVLIMYLAAIKNCHKTAGLCALISVLFRQTNIIWVIFIAGISCEKIFTDFMKKNDVKANSSDFTVLKEFVCKLMNSLLKDRKSFFNLLLDVIKRTLPYLFVTLAFCCFVIYNGSIVVGDKSHHEACLNFPQLFYFLCTSMVFGCCHMLSFKKCLLFINDITKSPFSIAVFVALSAYLVSNFTYVHEYLLADNRHYSFYVWSKIYRRHQYVPFIMIPLYYFCFSMFSTSLSHKSVFWKLIFFICMIVSLVPQKLFEFRYFIMPFLIWRLNINSTSNLKLCLEFCMFIIINAFTFYMFLYKPFTWPNVQGQQRFMW